MKNGAKALGEEINWKFLVNKFTEKYISEIARDKLAMEFQELKQGPMTIAQYDAKFTQLSRYAGGEMKLRELSGLLEVSGQELGANW